MSKDVVVFDMDGTLLDTERIYQEYWLISAHELGYDMLTAEDMLEFRSLGKKRAKKLMWEKTGDEDSYVKIRKHRFELMDPFLEKNGIPLKPGVMEALKKLKEAGFSLAVATGTVADRSEAFLEGLGLSHFFEYIISTENVENGKPEPDVYLYVCDRLDVDPKITFAVEDSPNGIMSAANAGCRVVMIPDITPPEKELEEHIEYVADDLIEAAEYIIRSKLGEDD